MSFSSPSRQSQKKQQGLTKQRSTVQFLLILPPDPMLAIIQKEAENRTSPLLALRGGSIWPLANTHRDKAPKEAIDMSAMRDIDLKQGGEHVLLSMWQGKSGGG
jgi:hypothetical protein